MNRWKDIGTLRRDSRFTETEKARLRGLFGQYELLTRETLIEHSACLLYIDRVLGKDWLWRHMDTPSEMTQHLIREENGEFHVLPAANPKKRIAELTDARDALQVKVFARFLRDVVESDKVSHAERKVNELRRMKFWAAFHEIRPAAHFVRQGCSVEAPRDRKRRDGRTAKSVDWFVRTPKGTRFGVECKHIDFRPGGWDPAGLNAMLYRIRIGRTQIRESGLPGFIWIHVHPSRLMDRTEIQPALDRAIGLLRNYPEVVSIWHLFDFFLNKTSERRMGLKHRSDLKTAPNPSTIFPWIEDEAVDMLRTTRMPRNDSILND